MFRPDPDLGPNTHIHIPYTSPPPPPPHTELTAGACVRCGLSASPCDRSRPLVRECKRFGGGEERESERRESVYARDSRSMPVTVYACDAETFAVSECIDIRA